MLRDNDLIVLSIDLIQCGYNEPTSKVLALASALYERGYRPPAEEGASLGAEYPEAAPLAAPAAVPVVERVIERPVGERVQTSAHGPGRPITAKGTQWGTDWVNPHNTIPPKNWQEKEWSGWGLNVRNKNILAVFSGENGRRTATLDLIAKKARLNITQRGNFPKPRYAIRGLVAKGLLLEVDRDIWTISPRGELYLQMQLHVEPAPKHDGVDAVA
jgi:hypothetical protein